MTAPPRAGRAEGFRCTLAALARGDSMVATAPPAPSWLLLERPGPWPVHALDVFDEPLARALAHRAAQQQARVALVRRPGRTEQRRLRWAFADCRPGREGIRWGEVDDTAEVLDSAWAADAGEGPPVALVCAHSRHDVCCALHGRPVAAALTRTWPERVWECSHIGGDRFAATMVLLPHGLCYGRVAPDSGADLLRAYDAGLVVPDHLRGRTALRRHEQAAQALALAAGHPGSGLGDLRVQTQRRLGPDTYEVTLGAASAGAPPLTVVLRERVVPLGTPATCRSAVSAVGHEYDLVELRTVRRQAG